MINLVLWIAIATIICLFAYWALDKVPMPAIVKTAIQIAVVAFMIIVILIILSRLTGTSLQLPV